VARRPNDCESCLCCQSGTSRDIQYPVAGRNTARSEEQGDEVRRNTRKRLFIAGRGGSAVATIEYDGVVDFLIIVFSMLCALYSASA